MMWVYTLLPKILNMSRRIINGSPLAFGECNIEDRIENVLNFKKPAAWVIVVSVALVAALSMGLAMNGAKKLELPDADDVLSIELEQFNNYETTGHTVISDKTQINNILNAMSGAAKTLSQSVNDYPIADNYLVVRLNLANKRKTLCLYKDGGNFIEEPYIGIYRAKSKFNYVYAVYDAYLHGTNKPLSGETNSDEPLIFASDETDLIKLGTLAFDTYMDYRMSENGELFLQFPFCPCPIMADVDRLDIDTWCQCTTGYSKVLFEKAFKCKVDVDLLKSIKMGDEICLMKIIPQGTIWR